MTDTTQIDDLVPDELSELKARADLMGLQYDGRWGVEKLRELVNGAVTGDKPVETQPTVETGATGTQEPFASPEPQVTEEAQIPAPSELAAAQVNETPVITPEALAMARAQLESEHAAAVPEAEETPAQRKYRRRKEATRLVRVNILNMNPNRKEWEGDTYSVGNSAIGTIKRYVPYGVDWHVEQALLNVMQERQCQVFRTRKDQRTGQEIKTAVMIKELQIAILPPLTEKELKELAQRQAMAAGTAEE